MQGALARVNDAVWLGERDRDLADDRLFGAGIVVMTHAREGAGKSDPAVGQVGEQERDADQTGLARLHARGQGVVARLRCPSRRRDGGRRPAAGR